MKTLYLLRHAQASPQGESLADFDRPLNSLGIHGARSIGEIMAKCGIEPDIMIASPAKRALQTAALVKDASGSNAPVQFDRRIYEASTSMLALMISGIDNAYSSAVIIGHNPGIEGLINYLTGTPQPMPTTSLASILIDSETWTTIATTTASSTLQFVIHPDGETGTSR